jgi:hypothetical protein
VAQWTVEGMADREIARRLGADKSAVNRHRRFHIEQPNLDRTAIIAKDRASREERRLLARAGQADEPSTAELLAAVVGVRRQLEKLADIESRLGRSAARAEADRHYSGVASIANARLGALRYGSQLGGDRNFTVRSNEAGGGGAPPFSIVIQLGDRDVSIKATPVPQPAVVEGEISEEGEGGV